MSADALRLGPLVFSWAVLLALATTWIGLAVATRLARRGGIDLGRMPETAALVGFLAARLGFVWQFAAAYLAQPWAVLDLRDGGWEPVVGFAAAWLYGLSRMTHVPAVRRPLRWGLLAATAVWLAGTLAQVTARGEGQRVPPLVLQALDGGRDVELERYVGQPMVVNLWATWCPPCVREMPVLQAAQQQNPGVHVVFINQGESADKVRTWLSGRGMALQNVLLDRRGQSTAALNAAGLPTTLFFDAEGRLVARRIGELSPATLAEQLARIRP